MAPVAFALVWVVHTTLLGVVALGVPRLFRMRYPASLVRWWGYASFAVVALPLMPLVLPPTSAPAVAGAVFVDSTQALLDTAPGASARGWMVSPLVVLAALWTLGAVARLFWLVSGHRRLRAIVKGAREVTDDPALSEARALAPRPVFPPFAASRVPVYASADAGPCAFGWRRVGILVPHTLRDRPHDERVAVYLHELVHIGRGDTAHRYADELWRVLWWWQPAVWWLLARLRLAREQEVDAVVLTRTGRLRPYVEALLWCSSLRPARVPSLAIRGTRHALLARVAAMGKGDTVSRTRRWTTEMVSAAMFALVVAMSGAYSPLRSAAAGQEVESGMAEPGPLERVAVTPTLDAPAPRRITSVEPVWAGAAGHRFRVHLVVDESGDVAEARIIGRFEGERAPEPAEAAAAVRAVREAVRQWRFEPPHRAPILIVTTVDVGAVSPASPATGLMRPAIRVGGGVPPPKKMLDVPPVYPQVARDARVQGVVIIEATVAPDGTVSEARVLRSIPLFDQAALTAVKQWRYEPTWLNGEAVPVQMVVTVNFTLQ